MARRALFSLLLALGAVLASAAGSAAQPQPAFDHLTTGFELTGAHRDARCEGCHAAGVFKATPQVCGACRALLA